MKVWLALAFTVFSLVLIAFLVVNRSDSSAATQVQGDLDCSGDVQPIDAITAAQFHLDLPYEGDCLQASGDLNCDGLINDIDMLWIMLAIAETPADPPGDCVDAGEALPADESSDEVIIDLEVTARLQCAVEVPHHFLDINWEVTGVDPPATVTITAVYAWGTNDTLESPDLSGHTEFTEADAGGGAVVVTADVVKEDVLLGQAQQQLQLDTCFPTPATPVPGEGFLVLATPGPPELPLAGNSGPIREVDVAHLGGGPSQFAGDETVVSVGTGAAWRLLSYATTGDPAVPVQQEESAAYAGRDVKLIAIKPLVGPNLQVNTLVAAYLRDGVLWLSTWQVDQDGNFTALDKRGFGPNLGINVEKYAIAQQQTGGSNHQVVTPIIGTSITPQGGDPDEGVRVVTWSVNNATGAINGLQASPLFGEPHEDAELSITPLDGDGVTPGSYVVAYRSTIDIMETQYWSITNQGAPFIVGKARAGYTRDGTDNANDEIRQTALLPLTDGGFVSPYVGLFGSFTMATWETRLDFCFIGSCFFAPFRMSDETMDTKAGIGVTVPLAEQPTLTNGSNPKVANGVTQPVRARLTDALWEEDFGVGAGTMYQQTPAGPVAVGIASVGKTMTLWLAAEMINNGQASLDDEVTVTATAVGAGGSLMGLSVGEKHTLRNLLNGMIIVSGNDAAFAVGEYLVGDVPTWVAMMNARAQSLNLVNTIYSRPSGGAYSTTQEQTTLWLNAIKEPLFLTFAAMTKAEACGTLNNAPVCYNLKRTPPNYPGWGGYKGGSTGFSIASYAAQGIPLCTACLLAEDNRLGRRLVVMLQQSGATGGDAVDLFDFGFLTLFTPDRVTVSITGTASDFGLDAINENIAIEAHIDPDDQLQVCTFEMSADQPKLSETECHFHRVPSMLGGGANTARTFVDGVRISTELREGDYLTGYWLAGKVQLQLWQIASKEP